jgi:superfamily II DNA or RNA helicase
MIKLLVGPVNTQIKGLDDIDAIDAMSMALSYLIPGHEYNFNFKMGRWDGRERLLTRKLSFPSGLVVRVCEFLKFRGIPYEVIENIDYPDPQRSIIWNGPSLYPYQNKIVERALEVNRGMIKVGTGGGKSLIIAKIVAEYNLPTMVYVISLDLLSQMKETLEETLGIEVGIIGGGECIIRKITICSVWTAGLACGEKFKKSTGEDEITPDKWSPSDIQKEQIVQAVHDARLVILDEAQFAAANSIRMILKYSTGAAYKLGLSATPERENDDSILLEAAFGSQICDISASELIRTGFLVPPKIAFRDIPSYHTKLPKKWPAVKSSYIVNNDIRNQILVQSVMTLLEMGRRPLLLFREIKHGQRLFEMISSEVRTEMVSGETSKEKRNSIRERFDKKEIDLILASSIFNQGINIPTLDALILACGGKSRGLTFQRIGRILRQAPGKTDALMVDTFDQAHYVNKHSILRYQTYKTEPEFLIKTEPEMSKYIRK